MTPRDHYPKAIVPSHVTSTYLRDLPIDTPAFLDIEDTTNEYYIRPTLFVTSERELRARLSVEITDEDYEPASPMGRAGIMRVVLFDGGKLREGIVADLRYVGEALTDVDEEAPDDQEELNEWLDAQKDSVGVDAFIANDRDTYNGAYYGPEEFYPALDVLRKRGNALLRAFNSRAKSEGKSTTAAKKQPTKVAPQQ